MKKVLRNNNLNIKKDDLKNMKNLYCNLRTNVDKKVSNFENTEDIAIIDHSFYSLSFRSM